MLGLRPFLRATAIAALAFPLGAHAADAIRENRDVSGFDRIVLRAVGDLQIEQGDGEALAVEAEPRLLPKIVTTVKAGTLYIDVVGSVSTQQPLRYHLRIKRLQSIVSEAGGSIRVGRLQTDHLAIGMAGSGTLGIARLEARSVQVRVSGAAEVSLAGAVRAQSVAIEGSGDYRAERLASERAQVAISGAGEARVNVKEELVVDLSGSSDVTYLGDPRVRQKITGAGSVRRGAR
jgi:Putative auto-transporter adhesin, head GIN domain